MIHLISLINIIILNGFSMVCTIFTYMTFSLNLLKMDMEHNEYWIISGWRNLMET